MRLNVQLFDGAETVHNFKVQDTIVALGTHTDEGFCSAVHHSRIEPIYWREHPCTHLKRITRSDIVALKWDSTSNCWKFWLCFGFFSLWQREFRFSWMFFLVWSFPGTSPLFPLFDFISIYISLLYFLKIEKSIPNVERFSFVPWRHNAKERESLAIRRRVRGKRVFLSPGLPESIIFVS